MEKWPLFVRDGDFVLLGDFLMDFVGEVGGVCCVRVFFLEDDDDDILLIDLSLFLRASGVSKKLVSEACSS